MRRERPGERAAVARLQHGRLDLDEAVVVERAADRGDHARAQHEVGARLLVHQQVEVAAPVALLDVGQAVERVRQRRVDARERLEAVDDQRRLAATRLGRLADRADDVAEVHVDRACAVRRDRAAGSGRSGRRGRGRRASPSRGARAHGRRGAARRAPRRRARARRPRRGRPRSRRGPESASPTSARVYGAASMLSAAPGAPSSTRAGRRSASRPRASSRSRAPRRRRGSAPSS